MAKILAVVMMALCALLTSTITSADQPTEMKLSGETELVEINGAKFLCEKEGKLCAVGGVIVYRYHIVDNPVNVQKGCLRICSSGLPRRLRTNVDGNSTVCITT